MTGIVLPTAPQEWDPEWANQLIQKLQNILDDISRPASSAEWLVSPAVSTKDRTIDPSVDASVAWGGKHVDDLREVVSTLIEDLRARGLLG